MSATTLKAFLMWAAKPHQFPAFVEKNFTTRNFNFLFPSNTDADNVTSLAFSPDKHIISKTRSKILNVLIQGGIDSKLGRVACVRRGVDVWACHGRDEA